MFLSQELVELLREGVIGSNFVNTHFAILIFVFNSYDFYWKYSTYHTFMYSDILNVWLKMQF